MWPMEKATLHFIPMCSLKIDWASQNNSSLPVFGFFFRKRAQVAIPLARSLPVVAACVQATVLRVNIRKICQGGQKALVYG
ncbi:hypothetical protein SAMN05216604_11633 [Pseudomonas agarici]|nr:hypothetical protein SAMN05216604_11633 [Pseudomonas agarici]